MSSPQKNAAIGCGTGFQPVKGNGCAQPHAASIAAAPCRSDNVTTAYFDCFNGAGGDMIVASLIDAGADPNRLRDVFDSLGLDGCELLIDKTVKQGLAATRFRVTLDDQSAQPHRRLSDIVEILERGDLSAAARATARHVFERLAAAEAAVHGTTIDQIHFHEVGAVDAILDVVGAVVAIELLGITHVVCSALPPGSGTIECAHGTLPVPAPATAELLKGVPLAASTQTGELVTPTAAALLTTLAAEFGPLPAMRVDAIGMGAGTRDGDGVPNVLRVFVGQVGRSEDVDEIVVLETNLDDVSPEIVGHCLERLLSEGALDAYALPIYMKKFRPGMLVTVLCAPDRANALESILFAETTTFGVRRHTARRTKMVWRFETVTTVFGDVRVKVGEREGVVTASPEFEDCRRAARNAGVPLRDVMTAARIAWAEACEPDAEANAQAASS